MNKSVKQIWFWQGILSPHMGDIAAELAKLDYKVIFVSNEILSRDRIKQGWERAKLGKAKFKLAINKDAVIRLANKAPANSIHFCQGLRGNGLVNYAQKIFKDRNLSHWAMLEKVDDRGFKGILRRVLYRIIFLYWRIHLQGVLAFGYGTKEWIIKRGMSKNQVHSFAYFLKKPQLTKSIKETKIKDKTKFRFIFAGQLIKRKNLSLLIKSIASANLKQVELWIIGDGLEKEYLQSLANSLLPGQTQWFGSLSMSKVPNIIRKADCLVLPSLHDGWGAVTTEALMVGTPVICSETCGSSIIVKASGVGGVFLSNNIDALSNILLKQYNAGKINNKKRKKISKWSKCLEAKSGAKYLDLILRKKNKNLIIEPWKELII